MEFIKCTHLIENTQTMTSKEILGASMLDILFDNRNKTYGAYELRKNYNSRLLMAMGFALGFVFLLLLLFSNNRTAMSDNLTESPEVIISSHFIPPVIPEQPPIDEKPAAPKPPKTPEASFSIITMVDAPDPEKEMAAMSDVEKSAIGTTNKLDGPENVSLQSSVPTDPVAGGKGSGKEDQEQSGFIAIEEQPEFPGGPAAWKNFLSRYLQVPASLNGGELKTVKINFMVDVDGSVTGFTIIQSAGREFDNEVIRVLKKMPKWKPAMQNGRPVSVPFTQPVTFVGVEQ
jgi:protein TonB